MSPYTFFIRNASGDHLTGYLGEMWHVLQNKLQFRSDYRKTTFIRGKEIVAAGLADIMLTPFVFEGNNMEDFEIGGPVATTLYNLYLRAPDDHGSSSSYLWTWSRPLWISYIGVLVLCTLLLYIMTNIRRICGIGIGARKEGSNVLSRKDDTSMKLSLGNCFIVIIGAATQQDVQIRTKVCSLRALLVVLLVFNHLMMTSYTSVLVSRLTVGNTQTYFTSLESIPDLGSVFLGVRTNSAAIAIFKVNNSSTEFLPRWSGVINKGPCHPDPRTTKDVASNICKEKCLIFEADKIMSRILAKNQDCDMMRLRPNNIFFHISILFRKHLPYGPILRSAILKMKNAGVLNLLEERFLLEQEKYPRPQKYQEVTIGHVRALVLVYAAAASLSCLLLASELAWAKRSQSDNKNIMNKHVQRPYK